MYNEEQIEKALAIYNQEMQDVIDREKAELVSPLIFLIKSKKDKLPGIQFSTGNLDDQYEVKRVEDDETLVLFQTWNSSTNEEEFEEMEITELSFDQMKEIFYALETK
jgi:hypothetical protein